MIALVSIIANIVLILLLRQAHRVIKHLENIERRKNHLSDVLHAYLKRNSKTTKIFNSIHNSDIYSKERMN